MSNFDQNKVTYFQSTFRVLNAPKHVNIKFQAFLPIEVIALTIKFFLFKLITTNSICFQILRYKMYYIFQQYGPVERFHSCNPHEMDVTLWRTGKSDQLKHQTEIDIEGSNCTIEWLRDEAICIERVRVAESLLSPPDQQSPNNIVNMLNDDCLRTIFESNHLSLDDLCAIGSVCVRFNEIVKQVFAAKHKNEDDCQALMTKTLWKIEEYFRIARNETVVGWHFDDPASIIGMIMENCTNLKKLYWLHLEQSTLNEMRSLFDQLTYLYLSDVQSCDFTDIFTSNALLTSLRICDMDDASKLPNIQLPKLASLHLFDVNTAESSLERFLQLNSQLTTITFNHCIMHDFGIERALKHLPNIENLTIVDWSRDFLRMYLRADYTYLSQLKYLKMIRFEGGHLMMKRFLCTLIDTQMTLDCLVLDNPHYGTKLPSSAKYPMAEIAQLPSIKCLKIGRLDESTLLAFTKCFGVAEEIEVFTGRVTLQGIHNALKEIDRSTKISFRLLDIDDDWLDCDDQVVDAIDKISRDRDIALQVFVEIDVKHNKDEARDKNVR